MTPLPAGLGDGRLVAWRLDRASYAATWDSGEGAHQLGGRWNSVGTRAVYCAIDPATAILEVAVHKGFRALDTVPHVLTSLVVHDPTGVHVVWPDAIANPHWLNPGIPSNGQQRFGDDLLRRHGMIVIPSVVSQRSWNLVFDATAAAGRYVLDSQDAFALDPRLHPPMSQ